MTVHPYIPASQTIKLEARFMVDNQQCENVYHYRTSATAVTVTLMGALGIAFIDWFSSAGKTMHNSATQLTSLKLTDLTTVDGPVVETSAGLPVTGTNSGGNPMPNNVSICLKWLTAKRGRSYRGRTYHVGLSEGMVVMNSLAPGVKDGLMTNYAALLEIMPDVMTLCVVSYVNGKTWRTVAEVTPITTFTIDPIVDSQRRRLPGRGR